jgi:glycosyltransferase involved in cell wall biosynthesis
MSTSASSELVRELRRRWLPSRFRILHCLRAPVGGLFRHVRDLATAQAALGHAVGVICDASAQDPLSRQRLEALRPHLALGLLEIPMSREVGPADLAAYAAARRFAQANSIDIIHGHGAKGGAYARLAARALTRLGQRVSCFYTPHGGSLHYHPSTLMGRLYMEAERRFAEFTNGLIFESAYSARVFTTQVGSPPCRTRVIHNGLLPTELAPRTLDPNAAEFLFIGELRHLKGVDVLLEALSHVRSEFEARLVVVGDGPDADPLKAMAAAMGLEAAVTFVGARPVREAFPLGRCLVVPSRTESFPYVVLEAAGAGLSLIATAVGGVPEIVMGTDTSLVPPEDSEALAHAMLSWLRNPSAAEARAQRLRAAVASRFTVEAMTRAVLDFYGARRLG